MKKSIFCLVLALCLLPLVPAIAQGRPHINWYEVFVYSYADSDGDGHGDLKGLMGRLDYIQDLGFDGLWLMPVMPSPSYHKYDVSDYFDIDPLYGSLQDMRDLVAACRARGIALIIDLVLNHTSTRHPWFVSALAALREGRLDEPHIAYYHFSRQPGGHFVPVAGTDWHYEEQFKGGGMPDLNLDNPDLRAQIKDILAFWLEDVGVDGFRLDAVTSYYTGEDARNIAFLRFLKDTAQQLKPGSFLVGECWKGLGAIADYYQSGLDSFFLFPAAQAEGYVAASMRARKPAATYVQHLERVWRAIPEGILTPFLSNHDTGRVVGLVQGRQAVERVKFAHGLLSLLGGYTFTYYGEEIGMAGAGADPNKRLGMLWGEGQPPTLAPPGVTGGDYPFPGAMEQLADPASLLHYIRSLNHLRLELPILALGQPGVAAFTDDTALLARELAGQQVYIAVNFSAREPREVALPGPLRLLGALDAGFGLPAMPEDAAGPLRLPPYGIAVLGPP